MIRWRSPSGFGVAKASTPGNRDMMWRLASSLVPAADASHNVFWHEPFVLELVLLQARPPVAPVREVDTAFVKGTDVFGLDPAPATARWWIVDDPGWGGDLVHLVGLDSPAP